MEPTTCKEAEPFALRVTDDSMEPEFECGCIVVIDPTGRARDGAYVVAEVEDGFIFRRLSLAGSEMRLVALNSDYPDRVLSQGISAVKGVVVQRAGARRRYHKRYD